jgi:hypothetical protein
MTTEEEVQRFVNRVVENGYDDWDVMACLAWALCQMAHRSGWSRDVLMDAFTRSSTLVYSEEKDVEH